MAVLMINKSTTKVFFLLTFLFLFNFAFTYAGTVTSSENISVSAIVGSDVVSTPGGGVVRLISIPKIAVQFSGHAYPYAFVHILKDGKEQLVVKADSDGYFNSTLDEKYESNILYTLFAVDTSGKQSILINYPLAVYSGYVTHLSGIVFAPTISTDKLEVLYGDYLTVYGFALPSRDLEVGIEGVQSKKFTLTSKTDGRYEITLPMKGMPKGDYVVSIKYLTDKRISKLVHVVIGDENIKADIATQNILGDCNFDGIINLVDFSVLAFWYQKQSPPLCVDTNQDGIINLIDFSILAYFWTG